MHGALLLRQTHAIGPHETFQCPYNLRSCIALLATIFTMNYEYNEGCDWTSFHIHMGPIIRIHRLMEMTYFHFG